MYSESKLLEILRLFVYSISPPLMLKAAGTLSAARVAGSETPHRRAEQGTVVSEFILSESKLDDIIANSLKI